MEEPIPARPDQLDAQSLSLSFTLSVSELARAQRRCYRLRPRTLVAPLVMFALLIVVWPTWENILFTGFLLISLLFLMPLLAAVLSRAANEQIEMSLDDLGIVIAAPRATTRVQWDYYVRLDEDRFALYLVERRKMCLFVVPKRAFRSAGEELAFRSLCASHLGPSQVPSGAHG